MLRNWRVIHGSVYLSPIEDWVDELTMLLMDVFAHKAFVREIQKKYFDGHQIIFCDMEAKLAETIKSMDDAVSTFSEYLAIRDTLSKSESGVPNKQHRVRNTRRSGRTSVHRHRSHPRVR
jgi:hypothetical protein